MVSYTQLRWKVDNMKVFKRELFVKRRFLLNSWTEDTIYYYPADKKRKMKEIVNPLVKMRIKTGGVSVSIKEFKDDELFETYTEHEIFFLTIEQAKKFLDSLGYVACEYFQKSVVLYSIKNEKYSQAYVCDFPWGTYVMVRDSKESIKRIGKKLGFSLEDRACDNYGDEYRKIIITRALKEGTKLTII